MLQPHRQRILPSHNDKENSSVTPYTAKTPAYGLTSKGNNPLSTKLKNLAPPQSHHLQPTKTPSSTTAAQRSLLKDITNKTPAPLTLGTTGKSKQNFSHVKPTDLRKTLAAGSLRDQLFTRKVEGTRTSKVSIEGAGKTVNQKNPSSSLLNGEIRTSLNATIENATNQPVPLKEKKVYKPKVLPHDENVIEYMPPRQKEQLYHPDFHLDLSPLISADPPMSDLYYRPRDVQNPHDGYQFALESLTNEDQGAFNATDLCLLDLDVDDNLLSESINVPIFDDPFKFRKCYLPRAV